jgi:hypothetical protein
MAMLEALLAASIAFAIGVPAFFEKVMRPGYEQKTKMYRKELYNEFRETLRETTEEFDRWGDITEEADTAMNALAELWVKVRNQARRFEVILYFRSILTVLWLFTTAVAAAGLYYQDVGMLEGGPDWYMASFFIFTLCLALTLMFVSILFDFDKRLLKVSEATTKEAPHQVAPFIPEEGEKSFTELRRELLESVTRALELSGVPFLMNVRIGDRQYDFVLPSVESPRVVVDVRFFRSERLTRRFSKFALDRIVARFLYLRDVLPDVRTVVISNAENLEDILDLTTRKWIDAVFHETETDRFIHYIREFVPS